MRKLFLISIIFIGISISSLSTVNAQGVGINPSGNPPDNSAGLDVNFNNKGFLPPRMSSTDRDAISSPADGLVIFNTTTNCLNFRVAGYWKELCGSCTPPVSAANAGPDQLNLSGTTATLAGNVPSTGAGSWTIQSGMGGSIGNSSLNNSTFTGLPGSTYVLRWTITGVCGTSYDEVSISFVPNWKYVFVTQDNVGGGALGGLSGADNICQSKAVAAGFTGTWKAWLSDGGTSAASRLVHYSGEYRLINGTKIADNWTDLTDGSLDSPLNMTEYGGTYTATQPVYTGSNTDGTSDGSNNCGGWTSNGSTTWVRGGNASVSNSEWTFWVFADCSGTWGPGWKLYCFQQ